MKNSVIKYLVFVLLIVFANNSHSQVMTGKFECPMFFGTEIGSNANIYYYVPEDYDTTKFYPLIVAWQGCGFQADALRDIIHEGFAKDRKVILACPDLGTLEDESQIPILNRELLANIKMLYNIDNQRKIVSGFSYGGMLAFDLALNEPELYNGIIGLAPATARYMWNDTMWANALNTRMAVILGSLDYNYIYVDSLMMDLQARGANLLYLMKPGVIYVDEDYYHSTEFAKDYSDCFDYVIGATNINDKNEFNLQIYPNPFKESFVINNQSEKMDFIITNILGNVVGNGVLNEDINKIDMSSIAPGLYIVKVGSIANYKTIKMIKY